MEISFHSAFKRDVGRINNRELLIELKSKILQIKNAKNPAFITGLKLLRGYTHHYRIIVRTEKYSFRIGSEIRRNKIWLIRFLPRKVIYKRFP
jgi:hypothetical protein